MVKLGEIFNNKISFPQFTNGLAIILTFGSIAVMISLIAFHQSAIIQNHDTFEKVWNKVAAMPGASQNPKDLFELFQNYYRETNTSNTNLFSILLPVIGAWVGAILAFYYGNKNFEKMSELKVSVLSPEEEKLAHLTVGEVLEKMPEYKKVITAKLTDPVAESYKKITANNTSNLVIVDENGNPLGIIYKTDFTRNSQKTEGDLTKDENKTILKDFFADTDGKKTPIKELIRDESWTAGKKMNNYAQLEKKDNLLEARAKMQAISPNPAVRGLVIDGDKVVGVITYETFSKVISEQASEK